MACGRTFEQEALRAAMEEARRVAEASAIRETKDV
jgi:hypothetical protein